MKRKDCLFFFLAVTVTKAVEKEREKESGVKSNIGGKTTAGG